MPWVRLDDGYPEHPKVDQVGPLAAWLNVCAWAYCARNLTDGFIPNDRVPRLASVRQPLKLVDRLVEVDLWERVDGGYQVHDYLDYNPSRAQVQEYHKQQQANGQAGGRASARARGQPNGAASAQAKSKHVSLTDSNYLKTDAVAVREGGVGETNGGGGGDFKSLGSLLPRGRRKAAAAAAADYTNLPPEVQERLARPPIQVTDADG